MEPNIRALKQRWFINSGSTLGLNAYGALRGPEFRGGSSGPSVAHQVPVGLYWVAVQDLNLSYYIGETLLFRV